LDRLVRTTGRSSALLSLASSSLCKKYNDCFINYFYSWKEGQINRKSIKTLLTTHCPVLEKQSKVNPLSPSAQAEILFLKTELG